MQKSAAIIASVAVVALAVPSSAVAQQRKPPYYAAISAGKARMRTGPGRNYPISWVYKRAHLPIKVVDIYQDWRRIEDPDGTQGWMQVGLLTAERTGMITGSVTPMRASASQDGAVNWRAQPGVIGKISDCKRGWCWFDVDGKSGYVEETHLWGVDPGEEL